MSVAYTQITTFATTDPSGCYESIYFCLSTDEKPSAVAGSAVVEIDTGRLFRVNGGGWTPNAIGEQGPEGPAGPQGPAGPTGSQGLQGIQGPIGLTGSTGATGNAGSQGPAGQNGTQGIQGIQGIQGPQGIPGVSPINVVVLASPVTNNNAVANTIANVTGLSFPVVANETYCYEFIIPYTAALATTGSRWCISGPTASLIAHRSEYPLTATTFTANNVSSYDQPAASNASSLTVGNVATMWGIIRPTANGTVIARFASEVASSAIVALAGATLKWHRVL